MNRTRRIALAAFSAIVLVLSVGYIARRFEWRAIASALKQTNLPLLVFGGGALIVLYWAIRAIRWSILLKRTNTAIPFVDIYLCTAVSLSFALFTPFQSGEALKVELLKKYGLIDRSPGYGSFLVERVLDLATVLCMGCFSVIAVLNVLPNHTRAYWLVALIVAGLLAGLFALRRVRLTGQAREILTHMRASVGGFPELAGIVFITIVSWLSVAWSWQVFLAAGAIHLTFDQAIALMSVVALISVLSLIPGGLGISEAGSSQLLTRFGYAAASAQTGAIVLRSYTLVAICLGAVHLGLWTLIRRHRTKSQTKRVMQGTWKSTSSLESGR